MALGILLLPRRILWLGKLGASSWLPVPASRTLMGQLPLAVKGPGFIPWPLGGCPILPQRLPCSKGPGPVQPLYALPAPGTEGAQQAPWHPHQQKAGLQLVGREGEDPEEAGPHAWSLSTSRAPCMAGQGCAHTLPPTGWSVARLSCSRPSCPPPAPVCSAAAAAGPAHPSPRQPGSRPCTW